MIAGIKRSFSGLLAQLGRLSATGANIANATTPGYKRTAGTFSEILLAGLDRGNVPVVPGEERQLALGVEFRSEMLFTQGGLLATGRPLDIAIEGNSWIELEHEGGRISFTREGSFTQDAMGRLVHGSGGWLPGILIPPQASVIDIDHAGRVSVGQEGVVTEVGQVRLVAFINPSGLLNEGQSTFAPSENSGPAQPNVEGRLHQGYLELSTVSLSDEMTSLIRAQRAYQASSQAVRTLDEMWENVNALRR